jgi:hypothetical protein
MFSLALHARDDLGAVVRRVGQCDHARAEALASSPSKIAL